MDNNLFQVKNELIKDIQQRERDCIIEHSNAQLIIELIQNAKNISDAIAIAELGTTYKKTGFHFDKRLEKIGTDIKYLKRNKNLSFKCNVDELNHSLIIGDNYDALLNLLISHKGLIDAIYIDPPYGCDSMGEFANTNYTNALTRDNLLSMLYPRLLLAKQLLSDEGVIFCSIDDKNHAYIKCLFDDIFDERNFVANMVWQSTAGSNTGTDIVTVTEHVLVYVKNRDFAQFNGKLASQDSYKYTDEYVSERGKYALDKMDRRRVGGHYSDALNYGIQMPDGTMRFPGGTTTKNNDGWNYLWSKSKVEWGIQNGFIEFKNNNGTWDVYNKRYEKVDNEGNEVVRTVPFRNLITSDMFNTAQGTAEIRAIFNESVFDFPKPPKFVKYLLSTIIRTKKDAIVLDFFAGSGTTGQAVLEMNQEDGGNRKFILCTNNEITDTTPNGIAYDVTAKRLKRIMTGSCYDNTTSFDWIKKNKAFNSNLDVFEIGFVNNSEQVPGKTPFDVIDETCYELNKFASLEEKITWVCKNFAITQKYIDEGDSND